LAYQDIIEELRLEGDESYGRAKVRALLRLFAGLEAKRQGLEPSPEATRTSLSRVRAAFGLFTRVALDAWLARNHLEAASLEHLIEDHVRSETAVGLSASSLDGHLLDELRASGGAGAAKKGCPCQVRDQRNRRPRFWSKSCGIAAVVLRAALGPAGSR
jgi:hypothetical protein